MGSFRTRYYSLRQANFIQFLKKNNLSFVPMADNPEEPDDSPISASQQKEMSQSQTQDLSIKRSEFDIFKTTMQQQKKQNSGSTEKAKPLGFKGSEKVGQKKKLKKKAYRFRLRRKWGTSRKSFLISRNRYHFSNVSNVAGIKYPELRLLHLYKLLEYFYFVFTNDLDFYEGITFSAKVALLRDKYGHAIVADLLDKHDHKQAAKVSVILHVTENTEVSERISQNDSSGISAPLESFQSTAEFVDEVVSERQSFRTNSIKMSPRVSNFARNLLLSYRYRFRI
jgi:hypothetical protein